MKKLPPRLTLTACMAVLLLSLSLFTACKKDSDDSFNTLPRSEINGHILFGNYLGYKDTGKLRLLDASDGRHEIIFEGGPSAAKWSPDGRKIAYTESLSDAFGTTIVIVNPDGSGKYELTQDGSNPIWSSNQRQIAYKNFNSEILVIDVLDKRVRKIVSEDYKLSAYDLWDWH